jgi:FtsP/CotA-like multicopper oxidase with cupredoxin domain
MECVAGTLLVAICACIALQASAFAQNGDPCPRPAAGSVVTPPPDLFSENGVLNVVFDYFTSVDAAGRTLFCFVTPTGKEAPTLHVRPGDRLDLTVVDKVPQPPAAAPTEIVSSASEQCGEATMTVSSVNVHFHGTNTSPKCHSDEVIHTIVNSGESFHYSVQFPWDEPPGLYWYHPHIHGIAEAAVQGGGSGAIIVEGIAKLQPAVAGLPQRVLIIRDQNVAGNPIPGGAIPSWDVTLNYVPIAYPAETPAIIQMKPGKREFWRVANASADTILDLQVAYDGVAQPLHVVAFDGVPTGSQDGTRRGKIVTQTDILLPPAGRAEFILDGPSATVKNAVFQTLNINTGPLGDNDPTRSLAMIQATPDSRQLQPEPALESPGTAGRQRFEGLASVHPTAKRLLYFSEVVSDPNNPASPTNFFITVAGATPTLFDPNNPPAITTRQGSVEDWTIQNQAGENHEFHMHQIHFLLLGVNGVPVPPEQQQFYDTYQVPFWNGTGLFPSITVRMDFRGPDIGDFVYHCHILGHEDAGMMAIIRVLPPS